MNVLMRKIFILFFLLLLIFCPSSANNPDFLESNSVQVIINGEKIDLSSPILLTNNTLLFPLRNLLQYFPSSGIEIFWDAKEKQIILLAEKSKLTFDIDSKNALLNDTKFPLSAAPTLYKSQTYIPLRIVSEFLDCRIAWDNLSKCVFIKNNTDFYEAESLFKKSAKQLNNTSSVKMDVFNEFSYPEGSFSFGHSVYVDKNKNKIYLKNILDSDWKLSAENYLMNTTNYREDLLPFCFSVDKMASNENTYVLSGFYPTKKGTLTESSLFIDTLTFQLSKMTSKTPQQTQSVLYQYEVKL